MTEITLTVSLQEAAEIISMAIVNGMEDLELRVSDAILKQSPLIALALPEEKESEEEKEAAEKEEVVEKEVGVDAG